MDTVAVVVLGGGLGTRFAGGDKLGAMLDGKPVAHHVLAAVRPFAWSRKILVCRDSSSWAQAYEAEGFTQASIPKAEHGMLGSIHRALEEVADQQQVLICLADMPLVTSHHVGRLLSAFRIGLGPIIASRSEIYRGPPAVIPTARLRELPKSGEGGARSLLAEAEFVDAPEALFHDIDTVDDLEAVRERLYQG